MINKLDNSPAFEGLNQKLPSQIFGNLRTPCYIIDEKRLRQNGQILRSVAARTGAKILLAQKAFSNFDLYPTLQNYIAGTEASGLFEARLGAEEMPDKEVHTFCAAYREDEFEEILKYSDHIVFNSPSQLKKFGAIAKSHNRSIGLRINPECSTQNGHEIYDPCYKGSRLGTTRQQWDIAMTAELIDMLDGLHFHTLCEQNSDALEITLQAVDSKFGDILPKMKWLNMGGGHHITRKDYDIATLEKCIKLAQNKWNVTVYLEPGEACALNAGYLATTVLDTLTNGDTNIAILDMSAACHTPDVIEMPYRPPLYASGESGQKQFTYRLGSQTCLAGDIIGDYSFDNELNIGDLLLFGDMAIYSTCKNNTFNGMPLPSIYKLDLDNNLVLLKEFGYDDFKMRLGSRL